MKYALYIYNRNNVDYNEFEFKEIIESDSPETEARIRFTREYNSDCKVKTFDVAFKIHKVEYSRMIVAYNGGDSELILAEKEI